MGLGINGKIILCGFKDNLSLTIIEVVKLFKEQKSSKAIAKYLLHLLSKGYLSTSQGNNSLQYVLTERGKTYRRAY
jgi:predicted transcriptional regulator